MLGSLELGAMLVWRGVQYLRYSLNSFSGYIGTAIGLIEGILGV